MKRLLAASTAVIALAFASPAAAETQIFVAYGEGTTACTIQVDKAVRGITQTTHAYFHGQTECNVPVDQYAQASIEGSGGDAGAIGSACSGFTTFCSSGSWALGDGGWSKPVRYRVKLRAPAGQGWVSSPAACAGVGTDNVDCVFEALLGTPYLEPR